MHSNDPQAELENLLRGLPSTVDAIIRRALDLHAHGQEAVAQNFLQKAIERHPAAALRVALARSFAAQNRHKAAMAEMVAVLREQPNNPDALLVLTSSLIECAEYDRGRKMLSRASQAGAPAHALAELQGRLEALGGGGAPRPNPPPPPSHDKTQPGLEPSQMEGAPQRRSTLQGGPNAPFTVGDPRGDTGAQLSRQPGPKKRLPPPPLQSGSFANLDTYDVEATDQVSVDALAGGLGEPQSDPNFDRFLADMGVSLDGSADQKFDMDATHLFHAEGDAAGPEDPTMHFSMDDADVASPEDATSAISFDEQEFRRSQEMAAPQPLRQHSGYDPNPPSRRGSNHPAPAEPSPRHSFDSGQQTYQATPSVEYDPGFAAEAHSFAGDAGMSPPSFDGPPSRDEDVFPPTKVERPSNRGRVSDHDAAGFGGAAGVAADDLPAPPGRNLSGQFGQARDDFASPSPAAPGQWSGEYAPSRRVEPTGQQANPQRSLGNLRLGKSKAPLLIGIGIGALLTIFVALALVSGFMQSSEIEEILSEASQAATPDTYDGYLSAETKLEEAIEHASFLGAGFDSVVDGVFGSVPGVAAPRLKRQAIAQLAFVSAMLEYRFDSAGAHSAGERVQYALEHAEEQPATAAASAYYLLVSNRPHEALKKADEALAQHSGSLTVQEVRVLALLELERPRAAARAVKEFRGLSAPSVRHQYLVAHVDRALEDRAALKEYSQVIDASSDHVDSRIERSYLLRDGEDELAKAQKTLDTVRVKLKRKASRYQIARATTAYGHLFLAQGEKSRAEDRFRDAILKMPQRFELYVPLLDFYFTEGRFDEAQTFVEKARKEGAYSPAIALYEARLALLSSEPARVVRLLEELDFADPRKDWLIGLAHLDLGNVDKAAAAFKAGSERPGEFAAASAFHHVARAIDETSALDDALHQLDRLKSKHPTDPYVFWAGALAAIRAGETTSSRKKRKEMFKLARADLRDAIELAPNFAIFHFDLCRVHLREMDAKAAEKACQRGRELNESYVPGMLLTARLWLLQGRYTEAMRLLEPVAEAHPDNPHVSLLLARVSIDMGQLRRAATEINRWLVNPPSEFELRLLEGRLEFAREQYTKAAGYLKKAHEMRPQDGEAAVFFAHTLTRLGQYENSDEIFLKFLSDPTWGGYAWMALGETRRRQKRLKDAFENFQRASRIFKKQPVPASRWSKLYAEWALAEQQRHGWDHPKVLERLEAGSDTGDANDADLNFVYSLYYLEREEPDYEKAAEALERVVAEAPQRCEAVGALVTLYESMKKSDALEKARKIQKEHCSKK